MDNELEPDKDSKPEAKMAEQFAKYGDLIVAFVVVQSLTFGYTLGQANDLQNAIVDGWAVIIWIVLGAGIFYGGLLWFCARWEQSLRRAAHHAPIIISASRAAAFGRIAIVVFASLVAAYGLYLNRP